MPFDYSQSNIPIREDLPQAYRRIWQMIAAPGNHWDGAARIAIAAESRCARTCQLCADRRQALSPNSVSGEHDRAADLPTVARDAVHRITTDPTRITAAWIRDCERDGLSQAQYVELLGIVVAVISIDAFHRAMGLPLETLPEPKGGEADGYVAPGAADHGAFVPMVMPQDLGEREQDLYDGRVRTGNVIAAMSLIPDSVRMLKILGDVQYIPTANVSNIAAKPDRALSRSQIELLAGRVSSLSECFY